MLNFGESLSLSLHQAAFVFAQMHFIFLNQKVRLQKDK
jgi:hypothetical protein